MTETIDEEYVEARRVLLDALEALGPHRTAVVVAGAQAIYLRAGAGVLPLSDYTTDADLALDPSHLAPEPELEALLKEAGFDHVERNGALEPGAWKASPRPKGLAHYNRLFARRGAPGIQMAIQGLEEAMPEATVQALCLAYSERLNADLA